MLRLSDLQDYVHSNKIFKMYTSTSSLSYRVTFIFIDYNVDSHFFYVVV